MAKAQHRTKGGGGRKPGRAPRIRVKPPQPPAPVEVLPSRFGLTRGQLALERAALELCQCATEAHEATDLGLVGRAHSAWHEADKVFRQAATVRKREIGMELDDLETETEVEALRRARRR